MPDATKTHIQSGIAARPASSGDADDGAVVGGRRREREWKTERESASERQRGAGTNFMLLHISSHTTFFFTCLLLLPPHQLHGLTSVFICVGVLHPRPEKKLPPLIRPLTPGSAKEQRDEGRGCSSPIYHCRKERKVALTRLPGSSCSFLLPYSGNVRSSGCLIWSLHLLYQITSQKHKYMQI